MVLPDHEHLDSDAVKQRNEEIQSTVQNPSEDSTILIVFHHIIVIQFIHPNININSKNHSDNKQQSSELKNIKKILNYNQLPEPVNMPLFPNLKRSSINHILSFIIIPKLPDIILFKGVKRVSQLLFPPFPIIQK